MKNGKVLLMTTLFLLFFSTARAKSGEPFNVLSDVHWEEIDLTFKGICICPRPPPVFYEIGEIWEYWEPFWSRERSPSLITLHSGAVVAVRQPMNWAARTAAPMRPTSPMSPPLPRDTPISFP